jgi:hypothetical protein
MTTFYKATFSDGRVFARTTAAGKKYTHAHSPRSYKHVACWASSEALARKQTHGEIAPAVEITGPEYRALKKLEKSNDTRS